MASFRGTRSLLMVNFFLTAFPILAEFLLMLLFIGSRTATSSSSIELMPMISPCCFSLMPQTNWGWWLKVVISYSKVSIVLYTWRQSSGELFVIALFDFPHAPRFEYWDVIREWRTVCAWESENLHWAVTHPIIYYACASFSDARRLRISIVFVPLP